MRRIVTGEQISQLTNPDPFAVPTWRAPVYRTPGWIIAVVQVGRLLWWLARLISRHPVADVVLAVLVLVWLNAGWPGLVVLAVAAVVILAVWRWARRVSFTRWIATPARGKRRSWFYRRRWDAVMTVSGLAPFYQGRVLLPVLGKVSSTRYTDRVQVRLVSGQSAADFADHADNLAHGFGALLCRVRTARSGAVLLELVRRDALAQVVPALPVPMHPDLRALPVGKREDGLPWLVRLHGTHLLIAGATGAGKASLLWSLVRAILPAMQLGLVRVLAADPKLMELAFGRAIFDTYGQYAADPEAIAVMLEAAVADMQLRAARFAGKRRDHVPTVAEPFVVVLVDEVAFLTAYQRDRKLRERIMAALATLTTQGRAVGYSVVAALQDPRKDVLAIRNLFPDRIAMRLDEPEQVLARAEKAYDAAFEEAKGGVGTWLTTWGSDWDDLITRALATARAEYMRQVDIAIDEVADLVDKKLSEAKGCVAAGRREVDQLVDGLDKHLRQAGEAARDAVSGDFDAMAAQIDEHRDALVSKLAQQYKESYERMSAREEELREANKSLWQRVYDATVGLVKKIIEFKNMLLSALSRAAGVISDIIHHPIRFLGNLVDAVGLGLKNFKSNIAMHLKRGLMEWIFGALSGAGLQLPEAFDLKGILSIVLQVLGLTYANFRARAVAIVGETVVNALEQAAGVFKIFMTKPPSFTGIGDTPGVKCRK